MEINLNTILVAGLGIATGIVSWVFKYIMSNLEKQIKTISDKCNQLEARQYEFENEKYNSIMEVLGSIRSDIAVLKTEITNLKQK